MKNKTNNSLHLCNNKHERVSNIHHIVTSLMKTKNLRTPPMGIKAITFNTMVGCSKD